MKYFGLLLLLVISASVAQVNAKFVMHAGLDNSWNLTLKKDFSYLYEHWSGFGGSIVIDSGKYTLEGGKIVLQSELISENSDRPLSDEYYFTDIKIDRKERLLAPINTQKKFTFFKKRYLVISSEPFEQNWIMKK
ncbi:MAG: hypothetical protein AAF487_13605 [Bacteroidota bacterium]